MQTPTPHPASTPTRILRKKDVESRVGICGREIQILESNGQFPKRFPITPKGRVVGWIEEEITAWIEARAAQREVA